jgi:hypothetical protein
MRKLPLSLLLFVTLNGCTLFNNERGMSPVRDADLPTSQQGSEESSVVSPGPTRKTVDGTEITWESPSEPVDGFVIRYGEDPKRLDKEVKLSATDLREEQDPEFGKVYRYVIRNVSPVKPLYVSIAAFKGDRLSDFSESKEESRE